ncbi:MAG TPA: alpha/beta family hydrolase [Mycobacteriales bacterium]|nr:alpha/beta family hydrolase [Mycobacteriales bacterium]
MSAVVGTPVGDAVVQLDLPAGTPTALLVLGHGAGGGVDAPDLVAVTAASTAAGLAVARVTQPYRVAGRRTPPRPPVLDAAWLPVVRRLRHEVPGLPLVLGGRSSGARVACRTAAELGAAAVVALAFPTRPPRTPDKDRLAELAAPPVPVLVVQGERDPFGIPPPAPGRTVRLLPTATHTIRGPAARAAGAAVATWLAALGLAAPLPLGAGAADLPG